MKLRRLIFKTTLTLLLLYIVSSAFAQLPKSTLGTEFWVAFGKNKDRASVDSTWNYVRNRAEFTVELLLRVTTTVETDVKLHFFGDPTLNTTFTVGAGTVRDYHLTLAQSRAAYASYGYNPNLLERNMKAIKVTTSAPISLTAINTAPASIEATLVLPVENLGTEYIHSGMFQLNGHSDGFLLVALEDDTKIDFLTAPTYLLSATLRKGEVYHALYPDAALRGTTIKSSNGKRFAYFQSGTQAHVQTTGQGTVYRDNYTYEQIPPVEQWGTKFIFPTNELGANMVRVFPKETNTDVKVHFVDTNSNVIATQTLDFWQKFVDVKIDASNNPKAVAAYIVANKPVAVSIYHLPYDGRQDNQESQPGIAWLPPVEQRVKSVLLSPLDIDGNHAFLRLRHYFLIIAPTASKHLTTISIDGEPPQPLPNSVWKADNVGGSGYSSGIYYFGESNVALTPPKLLNTIAYLENPDGITVMAFGQGTYTNYFYLAGAGSLDLAKKYSISGTVSGLPNNEGVAVKYTINGGNQEQTNTTAGGAYIIENIPAGANVVIVASEQTGYTSAVAALPSTSIVTSNIKGKHIVYTPSSISVVYAKVFSCHKDIEIDVLDMMGYNCNPNHITFIMLEDPKHAMGISNLNENNKLSYTLTSDFQGKDNLKFSVTCSTTGITDTVKLYINVVNCPDNIVVSSCSDDQINNRPMSIKLRSKTKIGAGDDYSNFINEMDVPLVGDIYSTGSIKILAAQSRNPGANATDWLSTGIAIFDGKTGIWEKTIPVVPFHTGSGTRAIAKVNGETKIFIASGGGLSTYEDTDNHIVCYDLKTGNRDWVSSAPYVPAPGHIAATVLVADVNGDGTPEVIAGNKIFNAATGNLLLDMSIIDEFTYGDGAGFILQMEGDYHHLPYFPAVADMANDGQLEFIAGYNIYKIDIPTHADNTNGSKITLLRTVKPMQDGNLNNVGDGATAVADLNGDGFLDVIVTRNSGTVKTEGVPYLYAWCGRTGEMFGNAINIIHPHTSGDLATHYGHGPSMPVVGDVDGCGTPEICVSTADRLHVFKYDTLSRRLMEIATYETNDNSGAIAMSLFDFNQDGKVDLVFHDYERLHILTLQGNRLVDLIARNEQFDDCFTYAQNEYPIVADISGDGRAEVIVFGSDNGNDAKFGKGYLYIFESSPGQHWAPARNVWNQWAYNAVNINNDLTVPMYQANPAIMYLEGGNCGKVQPYNAYLQQQTLLDYDGCYVWSLPNLQWVGSPSVTLDGDSAVITGTIKNIGDAAMAAPVYVTIYKNSASNANLIELDSINSDIKAKQIIDVSFTVKNISSYSNISKIIIGINEKDEIQSYQNVCSSIERAIIYLSFVKISGTVSGLPDNSNIPVHYTIGDGIWQSVTTNSNGTYITEDIPYGSSVEIIPSVQTGYKAVPAKITTPYLIDDLHNQNFTYQTCPNVTVSGETSLCPQGTIILTGSPSGGTWESSNSSVATVENGTVTGVSAGTAEIWYKVEDGDCTSSSVITITVNQFVKPEVIISITAD